MSMLTQVSQSADIQEMASEATGKLRIALGLSTLNQADIKRLSAALSLAAAEEVEHNSSFASRLKLLFDELKPSKKPTLAKKHTTITDSIDDGLVPIATGINYTFNPTAPPDPFFLVKLYGPAQLRKALGRYSATRLKETSQKLVADKGLPVKPMSKATKDELIEYIASQVAG